MDLEDRITNFLPRYLRMPWRIAYRNARGRIEREMFMLDHLVPHKGLALDIGANVGLYAFELAKRSTHVHAFEPLTTYAAAIRSCGIKNVTVHELALSSTAGSHTLIIPQINGRDQHGTASLEQRNGSTRSQTVQVRTLDSFEFKDVSFIKIDVEGHEGSVIEGAIDTLSRCKPVMLIEIEQRHHTDPIVEIVRRIRSFGYNVSFLDQNSEKLLTDNMIDNSPGHPVNFIFRPST